MLPLVHTVRLWAIGHLPLASEAIVGLIPEVVSKQLLSDLSLTQLLHLQWLAHHCGAGAAPLNS